MARRRHDVRRMPRERFRPVEQPSFFVASPPRKRVGRAALVISFFAAVVALMVVGRAPLDIRVGQTAARDYRARVDFEIEDAAATQEARQRAQSAAMRTFFDRSDAFLALEPQIIEFLRKVAAGRPTPALYDEAHTVWKLESAQVDALRKGLTSERLAVIERELKKIMLSAARRGLWLEDARNDEFRNGRMRILVLRPGAAEVEALSVSDTILLPEELRGHIELGLGAAAVCEGVPAYREALMAMLTSRAKPTLALAKERTEESLRKVWREVQPRPKTVRRGAVMLYAGEKAGEQAIAELRREREAYASESPPSLRARLRRLGAAGLLTLLLFLAAALLIGRHRADVMSSNNLLFRIGVIGVGVLALGKLFYVLGWPVTLTPLCGAAILYVIAGDKGLALGLTALLALLFGLIVDNAFEPMAVLLIGAAAAVGAMGRVRWRSEFLPVGLCAALAQGGAVWGFWLLGGERAYSAARVAVEQSVAAAAVALGVGLLLTAALPWVERLLGAVTDVTLSEWADQNHPLIRRLALDAPGTYHHSIVVGALAESAAEAIGANPILARAGGLLHDVGKLNKPSYFGENVPGDPGRRHRGLTPHLSALVIIAHVKDGEDLARQYRMPRPIRDLLVQHHGVTRVEFFYNRAVELAGGRPVDPEMFRYRGPRPRSREAGILLLADGVESASRSLSAPSPARVEAVVHDMCRQRLLDGQLDESGLTLTDVNRVARTFARVLIAVFHPRVEYKPASKAEAG